MVNYTNDNTAKHPIAHINLFGMSQVHFRNPYIVAWWSAAFPGFGHLFLLKYIYGFLFIVLEVTINTQAYINLGIIYTFQGKFALAHQVLDARWLILYLPFYFFTIYDSYRTTVNMNCFYMLAKQKRHRFNTSSMRVFKDNNKNPIMAAVFSLLFPGLGHLYLNRLMLAVIILLLTISFFYLSNFLLALTLLFAGELQQANAVLHIEWFLFLPSIYGFAIFNAYVNAVENNKLFASEQRAFLRDNYQHLNFQFLNRQKMEP